MTIINDIGSNLLEKTYDSIHRRRGRGKTRGRKCGRGNKGDKSRQGGGVRLGFTGGQFPFYRVFRKIVKNKPFVYLPTISLGLSQFIEMINSQFDKQIAKIGRRKIKIYLNNNKDWNLLKLDLKPEILERLKKNQVIFTAGCRKFLESTDNQSIKSLLEFK